MHLHALKVVRTVVVVLAMVAMSLGLATQASAAKDYDRQETLKGLLFGEGPLAEDLGRVSKASSGRERGQDLALQAKILRALDRDHRAETDAALTGVASGDPFQVEDGLRSLADLADEVATDLVAVETGKAEPDVTTMCGFIAVCGAVSVAAAALGAAVVVVVAAAVFNAKYTWFEVSETSSLLDDEEYVAQVTTALR